MLCLRPCRMAWRSRACWSRPWASTSWAWVMMTGAMMMMMMMSRTGYLVQDRLQPGACSAQVALLQPGCQHLCSHRMVLPVRVLLLVAVAVVLSLAG